jgi:hypothetical protein
LVATSTAQQIIDESEQDGLALSGTIYDVRLLYDENVPQLRVPG